MNVDMTPTIAGGSAVAPKTEESGPLSNLFTEFVKEEEAETLKSQSSKDEGGKSGGDAKSDDGRQKSGGATSESATKTADSSGRENAVQDSAQRYADRISALLRSTAGGDAVANSRGGIGEQLANVVRELRQDLSAYINPEASADEANNSFAGLKTAFASLDQTRQTDAPPVAGEADSGGNNSFDGLASGISEIYQTDGSADVGEADSGGNPFDGLASGFSEFNQTNGSSDVVETNSSSGTNDPFEGLASGVSENNQTNGSSDVVETNSSSGTNDPFEGVASGVSENNQTNGSSDIVETNSGGATNDPFAGVGSAINAFYQTHQADSSSGTNDPFAGLASLFSAAHQGVETPDLPTDFTLAEATSRINASTHLSAEEKQSVGEALTSMFATHGETSRIGGDRIPEQLLFDQPDLPAHVYAAVREALDPGSETPDLADIRVLNIEPADSIDRLQWPQNAMRHDHNFHTEATLLASSDSLASDEVLSAEFESIAAIDRILPLAQRIADESGEAPVINLSWAPAFDLELVTNAEGEAAIANSSKAWLLEGGWPEELPITRENLDLNPELMMGALQNYVDAHAGSFNALFPSAESAQIAEMQTALQVHGQVEQLLDAGFQVNAGLTNMDSVPVTWQALKQHENFDLVGALDVDGKVSEVINPNASAYAEKFATGTVLMLPEDVPIGTVGIKPEDYSNVIFTNGIVAGDAYAGQDVASLLVSDQTFDALINDPLMNIVLEFNESAKSSLLVSQAVDQLRDEGGVGPELMRVLEDQLFGDSNGLLRQALQDAGVSLAPPADGNLDRAIVAIVQDPAFAAAGQAMATLSAEREQALAPYLPQGLTDQAGEDIWNHILTQLDGKLLTNDQLDKILTLNSVEIDAVGPLGENGKYALLGPDPADTRYFNALPNDRGENILFQATMGTSFATPYDTAGDITAEETA